MKLSVKPHLYTLKINCQNYPKSPIIWTKTISIETLKKTITLETLNTVLPIIIVQEVFVSGLRDKYNPCQNGL